MPLCYWSGFQLNRCSATVFTSFIFYIYLSKTQMFIFIYFYYNFSLLFKYSYLHFPPTTPLPAPPVPTSHPQSFLSFALLLRGFLRGSISSGVPNTGPRHLLLRTRDCPLSQLTSHCTRRPHFIVFCFTVLHRCCICLRNGRQDPPPAKRSGLCWLQWSGTEPAASVCLCKVAGAQSPEKAGAVGVASPGPAV